MRTALRYVTLAILGAAVALACGIETYMVHVGLH
jgi:hypothetical protein